MARKVQSQLLTSELTRDRADALSLVLGETRAEIWRKAIEGKGLGDLEKTHGEALKQLDVLAETMGMTRLSLARHAAQDRFSLADLEGLKRYPDKA